MKRHRRNPGFTLVELLVVMTVIGMLMGLLLPAVQAAREAVRKANCLSNQRQVAMAFWGHDTNRGTYPSNANTVRGFQVGWAAMLLPYMDRSDLWNILKTGGSNANDPTLWKKYLRVLVCPSDPPDVVNPGDGPCAYVANALIVSASPPLSSNYIAQQDGLTTTLLVSENLRATRPHNWYDTGTNVLFTSASRGDIASNHGGGVIVAFCDGHAIFLRDDVSAQIYAALCTPDGSKKGEGPVDESQF